MEDLRKGDLRKGDLRKGDQQMEELPEVAADFPSPEARTTNPPSHCQSETRLKEERQGL